MSEIGTAWVTILPDVSKFGRELNRGVEAQAGKAGTNAGTSAGRGFGRSIMTTVAGLGIGIGIGRTVGAGLQTAMDSELADIKFTQLLGSADKAKAFITDIKDFAAKTPFDFPGLQTAAGRFLAVGTEAGRVIPIMTTLGDATSMMGTGAAGIDRATTALTQMQQKGKVTGEEMMQLTEAGIPAWDALASSLGKSVPEAQKLVSEGLVPADAMFDALETSSGESLQSMAGGMEKTSETLSGQWDTLKDTASQTLGSMFAVAIPLLKTGLDWITGSLIPGLQGFVDTLYQWRVPLTIIASIIGVVFLPLLVAWGIQMAITAATVVAGWISIAAGSMAGAVVAAAAVVIAFWPWLLAIAVILGVVAVIWWFWDEIKAALTKVWNWTVSVFSAIWDAIVGFVQGVWNTVKPLWDTFWALITLPVRIWWSIVSAVFQLAWAGIKWVFDKIVAFVKPLWEGLWNGVKAVISTVFDWIKPKLDAVKDFIVGVFTTVKDKLKGIWDGITSMISRAVDTIVGVGKGIWNGLKGVVNTGIGMLNTAIRGFNSLIGVVNKVPGVNVPTIPEIPKLAAGGIVTRPTLALVGEAGPEAVIPLNRYERDRGDIAPQVHVRVFIGDQELTHIVRTEIVEEDLRTAAALVGGRAIGGGR